MKNKDKATKNSATASDIFEKSICNTIKPSKKYGNYTLKMEPIFNSVTAYITYENGPIPLDDAQDLVQKVVVMAKELFKLDFIEDKSDFTIMAFIYSKIKGVTGREIIRRHGGSSYIYKTDSVNWTPAKDEKK